MNHENLLVEILREENIQLKKALANIQKNLADSVAVNSASTPKMQETETQINDLSIESSAIKENANRLLSEITSTQGSVEKMESSVKSINGFLKLINEISSQTNLLALNATIEAARAGESGKGFAVVATEVKELSRQTQKAVDSITEAIEGINVLFATVKESISSISQSSGDVNQIITGFHSKLSQTRQTNTETLSGIFKSNDSIFMSLAKLDHVIWKINTYLSILNKKPEIDYVDHNHCRLGKWYNTGEGYSNFSGSLSYKLLPEPHSQVHESTKRVFEHLLANHSDFEQIKMAVDRMESASFSVFELLERMLEEKYR